MRRCLCSRALESSGFLAFAVVILGAALPVNARVVPVIDAGARDRLFVQPSLVRESVPLTDSPSFSKPSVLDPATYEGGLELPPIISAAGFRDLSVAQFVNSPDDSIGRIKRYIFFAMVLIAAVYATIIGATLVFCNSRALYSWTADLRD